jgi:hypothetical protein
MQHGLHTEEELDTHCVSQCYRREKTMERLINATTGWRRRFYGGKLDEVWMKYGGKL